MESSNVKFIARTAILLALTIVFQTIGRFIPLGANSQFIVGPLVNACLIIAAATTSLLGSTIVALVAPFGAILTGAALPLPFAPFIAVGNFVLVLFYYLLRKKEIVGIITGAVLKFLFLLASVNFFVWAMKLPAKKAGLMLVAFSWPQLVTALMGGIVALIIVKFLRKSVEV